MIAYLEGTLFRKYEDRILLLANQVGYEVLLPPIVMDSIKEKKEGDPVFFYIYHHQTERQPKPVLIGFNSEEEKEFFQLLITVEAIGPLKAAACLTIPVAEVAAAIESKNGGLLGRLKGVGARTAQKMIATLEGKVGRFAAGGGSPQGGRVVLGDVAGQTLEVLVEQLGYKMAEARQMVAAALRENPLISTPEELFDEIFRRGRL